MHVELPSAIEKRLCDQARCQGLAPEAYASKLIEEAVVGSRIDDVLRRIQARFTQSNLSDDELGDLLEAEKHTGRELRRRAEGS